MDGLRRDQPPDTNRPLRVLWLIKGLGPGGAEQLLLSSARVIDHEQLDVVTAFVRPDKRQLVPALAAAGVEAVCLTDGLGGRLRWPLRLRTLMGGFDVVHAHSPLLAGVARVLARTLPRRPVTVSTEHNVWSSFTRPTMLLNALTTALDAERWAVSGEVLRSMWPRKRRGASVLIHGIVQDEAAAPDVRRRIREGLGVPQDAVLAVTVANFRREKDYPNLLRAARRAFDADPKFWVVAVGQGPLEGEVRDLHAELALGERFVLAGYRSDVPEILAAADIFVLGSAFEGLPVSIMEAMAAGLPVVATAVGGVPEAVTDEETGLLLQPHDDRALAEALLRVSRDAELRRRLGENARRDSSRFDIRTAVGVQTEAYARLAGQRRRSAFARRTSAP